MKLAELAKTASMKSGLDESSVHKALKAAMAALSEQIGKEERTRVPGLGVFVHKAGKEEGKSRILFKLTTKEEADED
jgi:nucleoid DNA-binding protein